MLSKIIWSYWEGKDNNIVNICRGSWYQHASDWEIIILNDKTVTSYGIEFPKTLNQLSPAAKSDIIRLRLLEKYGGLWMDASVMLHTNLKWLSSHSILNGLNEIYQYKISYQPWFESNFIFSPKPHNNSLTRWANLLHEILEHWPTCIEHWVYKDVIYVYKPEYFMVYQSQMYLMDKESDFKHPKKIPVNGFGAILPFILPSSFEPRYFTKFVGTGRKICQVQLYLNNVVIIAILIFVLKYIVNVCFK